MKKSKKIMINESPITPPHTGQFYYEIHSGPKKIEKKLTISNLKMPFTKVLAYNWKFHVVKTKFRCDI